MSKRWPTKPLGDLLSFLTSGSRGWAEYYRESGDLFLRIQNVGRNRMLLDDVAFVAAPDTAEARRTLVQSGDVLLSITADLGRTGVVPDGIGRAFINQHLAILRVQNIHPPFLSAYLASPEGQNQVMGRNKHAVKAGLNFDDIRSFEIPLPPMSEQRRIADLLDRAEALRANRRAALAELDSLTQSIFLDLFGDPRVNERKWPAQTIGSLISDMRGGAALEPDDFVETGFPILHKGALKPQGVIGIDAKKKTFAPITYAQSRPNNIVNREFVAVTLRDLVPSGPSIGLAADLRTGPFNEYLLAQGAYGFRVDKSKVTPEFLVHLSNNKNFRNVLKQNSVGSTQIHIRTPVYLAIPVPVPPFTLQREFARRVAAVETLKVAHRTSLAELDALFASLQHRGFRGEL